MVSMRKPCRNWCDALGAGLDFLWSDAGAALLEGMISPMVDVSPKMAFGKPISEMEPFATLQDIESTSDHTL